MERQSTLFTAFVYASALLLAAVILAPILWLFVMSISSAADLSAKPLNWWPDTIDLSRYRLVVVPALYLVRDREADVLIRYVADGGSAVVTFFSGIADEDVWLDR